jgi:hypothetical protein
MSGNVCDEKVHTEQRNKAAGDRGLSIGQI